MASRNIALEFDDAVVQQIVALRGEGLKWPQVSETAGVAVGKAMLMYSFGVLPKKEFIKDPTAADIVRLRNEQNLSWGDISVRCRLAESSCRSLFAEATGVSSKGLRIGKGGRHPGESTGEKKERKPKNEKVAEQDLIEALVDQDEASIKELLGGYGIRVDNGSDPVSTIKVKSVKKVAKGKVLLVDAETGESRTIKLSAIRAITKKKVVAG